MLGLMSVSFDFWKRVNFFFITTNIYLTQVWNPNSGKTTPKISNDCALFKKEQIRVSCLIVPRHTLCTTIIAPRYTHVYPKHYLRKNTKITEQINEQLINQEVSSQHNNLCQ